MNELLLVVDMQNGFVNNKVTRIIPNIISIIKHFKSHGKLIAFSRFINTQESSYVKLRRWVRLMSKPEISIVSELQEYTEGAFVFDKPYFTPYTDKFRSYLKMNSISKIFICGVGTDSCIMKAAIDIFEDDKEPVVIKDACFSCGGEKAHSAGLFLIARNIGRSLGKSVDEIVKA